MSGLRFKLLARGITAHFAENHWAAETIGIILWAGLFTITTQKYFQKASTTIKLWFTRISIIAWIA